MSVKMFELTGKNAVILGGGGILGATMARGLSQAGANIAVGDYFADKAEEVIKTLESGKNKGYYINAMDRESISQMCRDVTNDFGSIDILVNAVGGNRPDATTNDETDFFDLSAEAVSKVVELNLMAGAVSPSQIFGKAMTGQKNGGVIINVSSMNAFRPLTRIPGYSAAKAAVSNFTQWLAVDMAKKYGEKIRVNAIAPGFFLTDQNRFLLTEKETGNLTARGNTILEHTPMGRFGVPEDLTGTLVWLASEASRFVTGIVVPVDGGFSAFSGV